jgi:hypothetical protein
MTDTDAVQFAWFMLEVERVILSNEKVFKYKGEIYSMFGLLNLWKENKHRSLELIREIQATNHANEPKHQY